MAKESAGCYAGGLIRPPGTFPWREHGALTAVLEKNA